MEIIKSTIRFRNEDEINNLQKARELYPDKTDNDIFNLALQTLVCEVQEMNNRISELVQNRDLEMKKYREIQKLANDLFHAENTAWLSKQELMKRLEITD